MYIIEEDCNENQKVLSVNLGSWNLWSMEKMFHQIYIYTK